MKFEAKVLLGPAPGDDLAEPGDGCAIVLVRFVAGHAIGRYEVDRVSRDGEVAGARVIESRIDVGDERGGGAIEPAQLAAGVDGQGLEVDIALIRPPARPRPS